MDAHFWWTTCVLSIIANVFTIGFFLAKKEECNSYKEKASHWLYAYNRMSSSYMDLAKEKRNQ